MRCPLSVRAIALIVLCCALVQKPQQQSRDRCARTAPQRKKIAVNMHRSVTEVDRQHRQDRQDEAQRKALAEAQSGQRKASVEAAVSRPAPARLRKRRSTPTDSDAERPRSRKRREREIDGQQEEISAEEDAAGAADEDEAEESDNGEPTHTGDEAEDGDESEDGEAMCEGQFNDLCIYAFCAVCFLVYCTLYAFAGRSGCH